MHHYEEKLHQYLEPVLFGIFLSLKRFGGNETDDSRMVLVLGRMVSATECWMYHNSKHYNIYVIQFVKEKKIEAHAEKEI